MELRVKLNNGTEYPIFNLFGGRRTIYGVEREYKEFVFKTEEITLDKIMNVFSDEENTKIMYLIEYDTEDDTVISEVLLKDFSLFYEGQIKNKNEFFNDEVKKYSLCSIFLGQKTQQELTLEKLTGG